MKSFDKIHFVFLFTQNSQIFQQNVLTSAKNGYNIYESQQTNNKSAKKENSIVIITKVNNAIKY